MTGPQITPGPWEQVDDIQVWGGEPTSHDGRGYPILEACGPREWLSRRKPDALPWEERVANAKAAAVVPQMITALAESVAQMEIVRSNLTDAGVGNLGAGPLGRQCDMVRGVLRAAGVIG